MRMHDGWVLGCAVVLATALAMPAAAGVAWRWNTDDGGVAFTDDPDRIPERFKSVAEKFETGDLAGYAHLSPRQVPADEGRVERLQARSERLRTMAAEADAERRADVAASQGLPAVGAGPAQDYQASVEVGGSTIRLPAAAPGEDPIVVERVRTIPRGGIATQRATVVRQGDEIRMIVYDDVPRQTNPNHFVREDDLR